MPERPLYDGYPPHFPRAEFLRSRRATALKLSNEPTAEHEVNLRRLAWVIVYPTRMAMGGAVRVSSGYRSPKLNGLTPGSAVTSQHSKGEAADLEPGADATFTCADMFHFIREHLAFDQLIWEYGTPAEPKWIHVSCRLVRPRGKILVTTGTPEKPSYAPWVSTAPALLVPPSHPRLQNVRPE